MCTILARLNSTTDTDCDVEYSRWPSPVPPALQYMKAEQFQLWHPCVANTVVRRETTMNERCAVYTKIPKTSKLMYFKLKLARWKRMIVIWKTIVFLKCECKSVRPQYSRRGFRGTHLQSGASHLEEGAICSINWSQHQWSSRISSLSLKKNHLTVFVLCDSVFRSGF